MTSFHFGIPLKEKILLQFSTSEARKLLGNTTESMNDEETVDFSATRHLAPEDLGVINDSIVNFESTVNKLLELTQTPGKSSK
ncbi:hypothetical protein AGDE_13414 [Angomonas deanei]|nr:hypothetical protein AGDE_13414 [Angomonas deanei]|eukprot:EPY22366.1 hypothetical protein AGDE_13414 [Angomonas deanei]